MKLERAIEILEARHERGSYAGSLRELHEAELLGIKALKHLEDMAEWTKRQANKPPILTDERIKAILYPEWRNEGIETSYRDVVEAQRDADAAYYEPLIQQARREVAQEIFEQIERAFTDYDSITYAKRGIVIPLTLWLGFKSKYLEDR